MSAGRSGKRVADIEPSRLALLNTGAVEAATLTECLAVDFATLMQVVLPEIGEDAVGAMREAAREGISRRMALAARLIHERRGMADLAKLRCHASDTVRGWACFMVGVAKDHTLAERLALIRPQADDLHFGVREWSWMAVRPYIAVDPEDAIARLAGWTAEPSERLRRFASEATRPRGVWCAHIGLLRQSPEKALPILEPLQADPAPYVQDSVGNWLNDAGKDRPEWVRSLCARWSAESPMPATARIYKRALRSIDRKD
ncbi:DNA alkylation repair protein [Mesorhizobium plurifarium]|uniref:DNA alkylation repair protein n=1 Tax=Sinorhizobium arboris TaxID=76745 RepID=UPI000488E475|nr:DNA alkylation repair protein [Sinorhizobium arboris]PST17364.1 DNA alkylation repair protein [Mesorhizobium plurifarium]